MSFSLEQKIELSKRDLQDFPATIKTTENNEPLIKVQASDKLVLQPFWQFPVDELESPAFLDYVQQNPDYDGIFLRQSVQVLLCRASKKLPNDWQMIIRAGHRPLEVQKNLFATISQRLQQANPHKNSEQLLAITRRFINDPSFKIPPHCCGGAVDVDARSIKSDELIDFGCLVNTDGLIARLHTNKITEHQAKNRAILLKAMLEVGFASLFDEWWHFSYGDQNWSAFYQKSQAFYGLIEWIG